MRSKAYKQKNADSPFDFGAGSADAGQREPSSTRNGPTSLADALQAEPKPENAPALTGKLQRKRKERKPKERSYESVEVYRQKREGRFVMDRRKRIVIVLLILALALIPVTAILPTHLFGSNGFNSSIARLAASFGGRIQSLSQMGMDTAAGRAMAIYVCSIAAAAVAGAGLALNGAVFQGSLKNALASPSTLGVMSGATLGNVIYMLAVLVPDQEQGPNFQRVSEMAAAQEGMGLFEYFVSTSQRALFALAGCAIVVALVLGIAYVFGRGKVSKVGLLVSGQVFTMTIASVVEMISFYVRDNGTETQLMAIRYATTGNIQDVSAPYQVILLAIPIAIGTAIIVVMANRLNLLAFDEDEARTMGVNVDATRNVSIIICTVLTAVIVSFVGSVGFVGFVVPHLARKLVGPDFRYLIPASVCLGAAYLLVAYYLMNMTGVFQGSVGTFTSIIGIVFFAVLAIRQRARGNVDWI